MMKKKSGEAVRRIGSVSICASLCVTSSCLVGACADHLADLPLNVTDGLLALVLSQKQPLVLLEERPGFRASCQGVHLEGVGLMVYRVSISEGFTG